jgi:transcriptional regulator with GAF, ATPase, and Fis domain
VVDSNEFFRDAVKAISSSLRIDAALHRLLLFLRTVMPADELFLTLFDPTQGTLRAVAQASEAGGVVLDKIVPLSKAALVEVKRRVKSNLAPQALIVPRSEADPIGQVMSAALNNRGRSALSVALAIEGEHVAQLVITAEGIDQYTQEHARLINEVNDPLCITVTNALRFQELVRVKDLLEDDNRLLRDEMFQQVGNEVVGAQFGLRGVMDLVRKVASLSSPVILLGETGSGKDVVASAIHRLSTRKDEPFVKANCGAIPTSLIDSELFGHERGAFTGATARRRGLFERAHRGTLFLDEIGELPIEVQSRLLRVLQSGEFEAVGGSSTVKVDARIIAATNRNLRQMVERGQFREDLWYRLNVFPVAIPPLRERLDDLPSLVHFFLQKKSGEQRLTSVPPLAPGALQLLLGYQWPGNIRELQNVIERALILFPQGPLDFAELLPRTSDRVPATAATGSIETHIVSLAEVERQHIQRVLDQVGGRVNGKGGAAELLGVQPNTLRHRMRKLGIVFGRQSMCRKTS